MNLRNRRFFDVYRINLNTGDTRMVNRNGGAQSWWLADDQLNVRIAAAFAGTIVRERQGQPWRVARKWHPAEYGRYFGLSPDGKTFIMSGSYNGEVGALIALDLATGSETVMASDAKYDVEDAFVHPMTRNVQAVAFYKDRLEWQVLDQSVAGDFETLAGLRNGEFTVLHPPYESPIVFSSSLGRRDLLDQTWIVSYESDSAPPQHYLYDRAAKKTTFLFSEQPALETFRLTGMRPISYRSRDGLEIHGYLSLPEGLPPKQLPTVLYVHGGPQARDRWGFHNTIQWLANRGYAVLQVNYRGSTGYGRKFVHAGYKEWGGKMHDDLIDGRELAYQRRDHRSAQNRHRRRLLWRLLHPCRPHADSGSLRRRREQRGHQQLDLPSRYLSALLVQSQVQGQSRRSEQGGGYAEVTVAAVQRRQDPGSLTHRARRQ